MREIQGMVEVGKTINLNQVPFEHEGLKRVLPPNKFPKGSEIRRIERKMKAPENDHIDNQEFANIETAIMKARMNDLRKPKTKEMECQTELGMTQLN